MSRFSIPSRASASRLAFSRTHPLSLTRCLDAEVTCLREFARLIRRDRKYLAVICPMYAQGLRHARRARLLRAAYCLARRFDDVLDGDCPVREHPQGYVRRILRDSGEAYPVDAMARLTIFVKEGLAAHTVDGKAAWQTFLHLVADLEFDYRRAQTVRVLSRDELRTHWFRTFSSALDVTLAIVGATTRSDGLRDLIDAQGVLYNLRDLEQDLARGIVNIPRDVVEEAQRKGTRLSHASLVTSPIVTRWIADEIARASQGLEAMERLLRQMADPRGATVIRPLHRDLERLARRLPFTNRRIQYRPASPHRAA